MSELLTNLEQQLFNEIKAKALIYKDEPITLSSGKKSNHYFDMKLVAGDPKGITLIAKVLYDKIKTLGEIKSVGGLEAGSISLASTISYLSFREDPNNSIYSFFVRKQPKEHGLRRRIEGIAVSPVVVVDDVVTTGSSALEAIEYLQDQEDFQIDYLLTIVYRGTEELKKEIEAKYGVKLLYIFHEDDFTQ